MLVSDEAVLLNSPTARKPRFKDTENLPAESISFWTAVEPIAEVSRGKSHKYRIRFSASALKTLSRFVH